MSFSTTLSSYPTPVVTSSAQMGTSSPSGPAPKATAKWVSPSAAKAKASNGGQSSPPSPASMAGDWRSSSSQTSKRRSSSSTAGSWRSSTSPTSSRRGSSSSSTSSNTSSPSLQRLPDWRQKASPLPPDPKAAGLIWEDIKEGMVFKLPEVIPESSTFHAGMAAQNRDDGPQGHPSVIMGKESQLDGKQIVFFLGLTSFTDHGSNGIPAHKSQDARNRMILCANHDASVKPHNGLLEVENGSEKFKKATYLNFYGQHDVLPIEFNCLKTWDTNNNRPIQFTAASVQKIKKQHNNVRKGGFISG